MRQTTKKRRKVVVVAAAVTVTAADVVVVKFYNLTTIGNLTFTFLNQIIARNFYRAWSKRENS